MNYWVGNRMIRFECMPMASRGTETRLRESLRVEYLECATCGTGAEPFILPGWKNQFCGIIQKH